jgi:hypothetical protein
MKISFFPILFTATVFATPALAVVPNSHDLIWQSITFGQSTDLNFGSTVLPEKVGVNETLSEGKPVSAGVLVPRFTIESRGGKLANSHEGVTYYYTELPADINFRLSADIKVEQLGPETGANPNRQEGAGIMLRDILGKARENPQPMGHEEFPAASNMVMNLIRTHSREQDALININASYREGIQDPWGTAGNRLVRTDYVEAIDFAKGKPFNLMLEKNNQGFILKYRQEGKTEEITLNEITPDIIRVQNPDKQYLGFFAARNAKIAVENVKLELSEGSAQVSASEFLATPFPLLITQESSSVALSDDYDFQARANYDGNFTLFQNGKRLAEKQDVKAGDFFHIKTKLENDETEFRLHFTPSLGDNIGDNIGANIKQEQEKTLTVIKSHSVLPQEIYVAVNGSSNGDGSIEKPLDLDTAIQHIPPGGTILLQPWDYPAITLLSENSGTEKANKKLKGVTGKVRFVGEVLHQASFWQIEDIEVAGASLIVHGSHNEFKRIITHSAPDTGFQITSPEGIGRALWASHNIVKDSISFNNMDKSQINADGFAAKMRIGDGNTFIRCISHHNIDDGWDLFNKVEDGPNGSVTILDSIAFMNGQTLNVKSKSASIGNGFKLGGEGIPVAHVVKNNLALRNNMDGFTDNFNPGTLIMENNVAIDNKRFNYLFRKSPYENGPPQGIFINNRSFRFHQPSAYFDIVNGSRLDNNQFIIALSDGTIGSNLTETSTTELLTKLRVLSEIDFTQPTPGLKEAQEIQKLTQ